MLGMSLGRGHIGLRLRRSLAAAALALGLSTFAAQTASALTFVVDFKDAGQGITADAFGTQTIDFDITSFGFAAPQFGAVTSAIMAALEQDYHGIVTSSFNVLSPIPGGQELDIDFVIGDIGGGAANGDADFYYIQVGDRAPGNSETYLGLACLACVRGGVTAAVGTVVGSVLTDNLANILGGAVAGDLGLMANVINGTLAHEIGHSLSLDHCNVSGATTDNGNPPLMASGSTGLPNASRLLDREFAFACNVPASEGGGVQNSVQQLANVLGLRDAPAQPEYTVAAPGMTALFGLGVAGIGIARRRGRKAA